MSSPWIVAFGVLWVVVLLIALIVVGVLRRITAVLERAEAHLVGGPRGIRGAPAGTELVDFEVIDESGDRISSSRLFQASAAVLFVSPKCAPCERLLADLEGAPELTDGVPLVVIGSRSQAEEHAVSSDSIHVYREIDRSATQAFDSTSTPHVFLVGEGGIVVDSMFPTSASELRRFITKNMRGGDQIDSSDEESIMQTAVQVKEVQP